MFYLSWRKQRLSLWLVTAITNSAGVFSAYALVVVMNNSFGSRSGFNDIRKLEDVCVCCQINAIRNQQEFDNASGIVNVATPGRLCPWCFAIYDIIRKWMFENISSSGLSV